MVFGVCVLVWFLVIKVQVILVFTVKVIAFAVSYWCCSQQVVRLVKSRSLISILFLKVCVRDWMQESRLILCL